MGIDGFIKKIGTGAAITAAVAGGMDAEAKNLSTDPSMEKKMEINVHEGGIDVATPDTVSFSDTEDLVTYPLVNQAVPVLGAKGEVLGYKIIPKNIGHIDLMDIPPFGTEAFVVDINGNTAKGYLSVGTDGRSLTIAEAEENAKELSKVDVKNLKGVQLVVPKTTVAYEDFN